MAALQELHAKAYVAVGLGEEDHELIVTSTNLTRCGLRENIELGLRITALGPAWDFVARQILACISNPRSLARSLQSLPSQVSGLEPRR